MLSINDDSSYIKESWKRKGPESRAEDPQDSFPVRLGRERQDVAVRSCTRKVIQHTNIAIHAAARANWCEARRAPLDGDFHGTRKGLRRGSGRYFLEKYHRTEIT